MQWFLSLPAWEQSLLASALMYAATTAGACLVFFVNKIGSRALSALTGGAAGIMIAASFFSLLLPALDYETPLPGYVTVTLGFFLGGAFILCSDLLLTRRERRAGGGGSGYKLLYFAVTLHNIPEGLAVGVAFAAAAASPSPLAAALSALLFAVGIAVQNFPEGACVAFPLRAQGMSRTKSFVLSQASGAVEVPACVCGALAAVAVSWLLPWALAFSAGAMIAVVCSELIPECFEKSKGAASLGVVIGFCLMMLLDVALG